MTEIPAEYKGWWRIIETSRWPTGLDLSGLALISLNGGADRLRMHYLLADVKCRPIKAGVAFTWKGSWEFDRMSGTGRVTLGTDGQLLGVFRIKGGDSSTFVAVRAQKPDRPIPSSYRDKWQRPSPSWTGRRRRGR